MTNPVGRPLAPTDVSHLMVGVAATGSPGARYGINYLQAVSDNISNPNHTTSLLLAEHTIGGAGCLGGFIGAFASIVINAKTDNIGVNNGDGQYAGAEFGGAALVNDNGTALSPQGILFGGNANVSLTTAATFWLGLVGFENDVAVDGNSSVADLIGEQTVQTSLHATPGSRSNIGYSLNSASGTPGWDCGYCVGAYSGYWPMSANGTIIGAWAHGTARNSSGQSTPSANAGTTLNGVDFSNVTFTGAAFKSSGFSVNGSGDIVAKSFTPGSKPAVTGSRGSNAALASLLTALAALGLITDSTT